MATRRNAFRDRVGLQGWILDPRTEAENRRPPLVAHAVDLSRTGVGLLAAGWPEPGSPVRIALEDTFQGQPIGRQWSGRITHARSADASGALGVRIGVAFDWPTPLGARPGSSPRSTLFDPTPAADLLTSMPWFVPAVALAGLAADQITKAWAVSAGSEIIGLVDAWPDLLAVAPVQNPGTLASLAADSPLTAPLCAAVAIALAGYSVSVSRSRATRHLTSAAGAGLLGAGLLGNSADRLALGYVRDFLVSGLFPQWSFNLADLFLVAGAFALLIPASGPRQQPGQSP